MCIYVIMVEYICKKCGKIFDQKIVFDRHKNRKTDCSGSGSKTHKRTEHKCKKCKKNFSRKDALKRHTTTCKTKITKNKTKVKGDNNTTTTVAGNKNIVNSPNSNITVNKDYFDINLFNFPPDRYSIGEDIGKILESDDLIISMVNHTNINKNKPEHHNIYYKDHHKNDGEIFTNNKWNTKKIDEILNMMLEAINGHLNGYLKDMNCSFNDKTKDNLNKANREFYNSRLRKEVKSHLKIMLYDNRKMIEKTKRLAKNSNPTDDELNEYTESKSKRKVIYESDSDDDDEDESEKKSKKKSKKH